MSRNSVAAGVLKRDSYWLLSGFGFENEFQNQISRYDLSEM